MSVTKKGHGRSVPVATINQVKRPGPSLSAPIHAGVIFVRSDTPFHGDGTRVQLTREEGFTPPGKLDVPFRFQLPPNEAIVRTAAHNWPTFDVLDVEQGASERSRSGGRKLRTGSIASFFMLDPHSELPFTVWSPGPGLMNPLLAARELEHLCLDGVRCRLRVHNPNLHSQDDVNMIVSLGQCTITEQTGEPDTRYVSFDYQEYVPTEVERKAIHNVVGPWTHTIKDGDTLYRLSSRYYKRRSDWQRIAHANKGMEHQPPSHNLMTWRKKHHRKSIHIPQASNARLPVSV